MLRQAQHDKEKEKKMMKTEIGKLKFVAYLTVCWVFAAVCTVFAATPNAPEDWESGGVEGWTGQDPLNSASISLSNPSNHLEVVFDSQEPAMPEIKIVKADVNASSGDFAGNYWLAAVTNVSFKLHCDAHVPADLSLCMYSEKTGNKWYYSLPDPATDAWTDYNIPLEYEAGWSLASGGNVGQFIKDRKKVTWIGLRFQRNGTVDEQIYGIDSFVLQGESDSEDDDGDGMSNWHEFLSGTDSGDPTDKLQMLVGNSTNVNGLLNGYVIRWRSSANRAYTVNRSENLQNGFWPLATGLPGTPPVNEYIDTTISGDEAYFYFISIDE